VRARRSIGARRDTWIGAGVDDAIGIEHDTRIVGNGAATIVCVAGDDLQHEPCLRLDQQYSGAEHFSPQWVV
jgi:hypothetical protein